MDLNLKDKVAVITGGGSGIGKELCLLFAREGARVVVSDMDSVSAKKVSEKIFEMGSESVSIQCDVSSKKDVSELIKQVIEKLIKIDIFVNSAGISPKKNGKAVPLWEIESDEWDKVININLTGAFYCCQEVSKQMIKQKGGTIINIASIAGKAPNEPMASSAHYTVSKAGLINLTQRIAGELAQHGIRVNAIAPGVIQTPLSSAGDEKIIQKMLERTPLGRFGKPEEIGNLVLYLASDISAYITGETININGGWLMD